MHSSGLYFEISEYSKAFYQKLTKTVNISPSQRHTERNIFAHKYQSCKVLRSGANFLRMRRRSISKVLECAEDFFAKSQLYAHG